MRRFSLEFLLAAALLFAAPGARADLSPVWDTSSGTAAAAEDDASETADSGDAAEASSLDEQIEDLLSDETLQVSSSETAENRENLAIAIDEADVWLERLAVLGTESGEEDAEGDAAASAPTGGSDGTFATGTESIAARVTGAFAARASAASGGAFTATDSARNYTETFNTGDNGGSGFGAWRQIAPSGGEAVSLPNRSIDNVGGDAVFSIYANDGAGEAAIGRSFADGTSLDNGTFTVEATHAFSDFGDAFSGFAVYGEDDDEILRWGVTRTDDGSGYKTGFWYSTGNGYQLIATHDEDALRQTQITYSLTWSALSGGEGLSLQLDILEAGEKIAGTDALTSFDSSAVTAISAIVTGSVSGSESDKLHFDDLSVELRAVPEPGTLVLLLAALPFLARRRR